MITVGVNEKRRGNRFVSIRRRLRLSDKNPMSTVMSFRALPAAAGPPFCSLTDLRNPLAYLTRALAVINGASLHRPRAFDSLALSACNLAATQGSSDNHRSARFSATRNSRSFTGSGSRVAASHLGLRSMPVSSLMRDDSAPTIENEVRYAIITISKVLEPASMHWNGLRRIAEIVLRDERTVVPIGVYQLKTWVTLSLPGVVGPGRLPPDP